MTDVCTDKLHCLGEWVRLLLSQNPFQTADINRIYLRLVDLIKGSHLEETIPSAKALPVVIKTLSDFYTTDVTILIPELATGQCSTDYTKSCLLILILTMGLRSKCQPFMKSAFRLPSSLHHSVVELTQPLIGDPHLSVLSFTALTTPSENQPSTPIRPNRLIRAPVTCPAGGRLLPPFLRSPPVHTHSSLPEPLSSVVISEDKGSPLMVSKQPFANTLRHANIFYSPPHVHKGFRRPPYGLPASVTFNDELISLSSPLHSLQSLLDSPDFVPKSQFIGKLEEMRHLSAQLSELQHLYDEAMTENSQLAAVCQTSQLKCTEMEIRLKRRDSDLAEVRDELICERESRINSEVALQQLACLRDRLHNALEQLKDMNHVSEENRLLHRELTELRSKLKSTESARPKLLAQKHLEHQISHMKDALRMADEKIVALITEREQIMSVARTEQHSATNWPSNRSHSQPTSESSILAISAVATTSISLLPDSSQPDLGSRVAEEMANQAHLMDCGTISQVGYSNPESLASVLAADGQLRCLENALTEAQMRSQSMRSLAIRQRFRAIAAMGLAASRRGELRLLKQNLQAANEMTESIKSLYDDKLLFLESQLLSLQGRIKRSEELIDVYQAERRTSHEEQEIAEAGTRQRIETLTAELHFTSLALQQQQSEVCDLQSHLNVIEANLVDTEAARQEAEIELAQETARLEGEILALNCDASKHSNILTAQLHSTLADLKLLQVKTIPSLHSRLQDVCPVLTECVSTKGDQEDHLQGQLEVFHSNMKTYIEQLTAELHFASLALVDREEKVERLRSYLEVSEATLIQLQTEYSELFATMDHLKLESNMQIERLSAELNTMTHALDHCNDELKKVQVMHVSDCQAASTHMTEVKASLEGQCQHLHAENTRLLQQIDNGQRSCRQLTDQLEEQLQANAAYRKATEDEVDRLRHKLTTMSAENDATYNEMNQQHRLIRERLNADLEQHRETEKAALRRAAQAQVQLDEAHVKLDKQNEQLIASCKHFDHQQSQLTALQLEIDTLKARVNSDEARITDSDAHIICLQNQLTEETFRCGQLEIDNQLARCKITDLTTQVKQLEDDTFQKAETVHQMQTALHTLELDRGESDRRYAGIREQLRQMEADWMHSQAQLAHTRTQLSEVTKLQHETSLRLMEKGYSCAEVERRLSVMLKRHNDFGSRLTRSTLALVSTSSTDLAHREGLSLSTSSVQTSDTALYPVPYAVSGITSSASPTRISQTPECTPPTVQHKSQVSRDVAVQKCAHHTESGLPGGSKYPVSCWQLKAGNSTVSISPQKGSLSKVCSANLPEVHARRFCRLLLTSDDFPIVGFVETKSVPTVTAPVKETSAQPVDTDMPSETTVSPTFIASSPRRKTISGLPDNSYPTNYIPETPFHWNTSSFSAQRPEKPGQSKDKKRPKSVLFDSNSGEGNSHKVFSLFRVGKQHKRSKLPLDGNTDAGRADCSNASSDSVFTKPLPPKHASHHGSS